MLNYTSKILAAQTAGECAQLLAKAGASSVLTHYGDDGQVVGLGFLLRTAHGFREFDLPVAVGGVKRALAKQKMPSGGWSREKFYSDEHAGDVAWRVAKDWLEAQLALIEAEMATLDQVMLPYLVTGRDGEDVETLYDRYVANERKAIGA